MYHALFECLSQTLVSVSTIGTQDQFSDEHLADEVKSELGPWFGTARVAAWKLLRVYRIPFAQPDQVRAFLDQGWTGQHLAPGSTSGFGAGWVRVNCSVRGPYMRLPSTWALPGVGFMCLDCAACWGQRTCSRKPQQTAGTRTGSPFVLS